MSVAAAARRPPRLLGGLLRDPSGRFSWLRTVTLLLIALPGALTAARLAGGDLGPRGVHAAILIIGHWTIRFLLITLAVTPARALFDLPRVVQLRRMLGVGTACYAVAHLTLYAADNNFHLLHVASEIARRFYLTIGFVALLGLLALAITSTDGWQRRLRGNWKRLHKLVYPVAVLGLLHYFLQSKADISDAVFAAGLFIWLLLWRAEPKRWQTRRLPLPALAVLAAGLAAALEAAWYWGRNNAPPARVLAANLRLDHPRPALFVAAAALLVFAVALLRGLWSRRRKPARRRSAQTA